MDKDIKILEEWIRVDRGIRNNSTESDFDKYCRIKQWRKLPYVNGINTSNK